MIRSITTLADLLLVMFIVREVLQFARRYRRLKEEAAAGDLDARPRLYRRILRFQWISAGLAMAGLDFDWNALRPQTLDLESLPLVQSFVRGSQGGMLGGIAVGVAMGTLGLVLMRLRARRAGGTGIPTARVAPWRRLVPDFNAILPVTIRERWMWLAVSISAGVCEEIVFRGWLLSVLHTPIGLAGTTLVVAAAAAFGLAHSYQGAPGMVLAGLAGALLSVLYVATAGLLVPMAVHAVIDARFALLPAADAGRAESAPAIPGLRTI